MTDAGTRTWEPVARLVQDRADRLAERLRGTVPDLRVRVRHDSRSDPSALAHASWVAFNRDAQRRDTDDVLVELVFTRETGRANVTLYDRDETTLLDEDLPFELAAGVEQALAVTRRALDLVEEHVAEIEAELRATT